ncbi:Ig-like domain-containing protein, partial [Klebsiella pneumoniae]|uniref:Ig-like domain-containing protein n=2 Tax=Enterobacteriaceae TaxID=543 RepID=UPI0025A0465F
TGTTEADGTLSLPVTSIKAGDSNITASIKGSKQSVKMTFSPDNATATVNSLVVISDKSVANGTASNSVKAIVRDAKGNYVPDMVVYFSA